MELLAPVSGRNLCGTPVRVAAVHALTVRAYSLETDRPSFPMLLSLSLAKSGYVSVAPSVTFANSTAPRLSQPSSLS
jgi:hypothetical protein